MTLFNFLNRHSQPTLSSSRYTLLVFYSNPSLQLSEKPQFWTTHSLHAPKMLRKAIALIMCLFLSTSITTVQLQLSHQERCSGPVAGCYCAFFFFTSFVQHQLIFFPRFHFLSFISNVWEQSKQSLCVSQTEKEKTDHQLNREHGKRHARTWSTHLKKSRRKYKHI